MKSDDLVASNSNSYHSLPVFFTINWLWIESDYIPLNIKLDYLIFNLNESNLRKEKLNFSAVHTNASDTAQSHIS